jgi:hypothetical protein
MKTMFTCIACLFCLSTAGVAQNSTPATGQTAVAPASDTAAAATPKPTPATSDTVSAPAPAAAAPVVRNTLPVAPVGAPSTKPAASSAVVEESEDDLILDGGEESIIAPAAVPVAAPRQAQSADSAKTADMATVKTDSTATGSDTAAAVPQEAALPAPLATTPAQQTVIEKPTAPARIENTRSINFAKNFKEYRSPKVAILLSLLLPGAGQVYAHNNLKAAVFGAVEIGLITTSAVLAYKGGKRIDEAHRYADEHYDTTLFNTYYKSMKVAIPGADTSVFGMSYLSADTFMLYAGQKNQDYYNAVGNEVSPFVQGWDDVKPRFDSEFRLISRAGENYFVNPDSIYLVSPIVNGDTAANAMFGFSDNQKTYNRKLNSANGYYGWSQKMLAFLLINHIISAIDAGITAKAFNDRLLGKSSAWQRINLRDNYVRTPAGTAQGYALEVRF